MEIRIEAGCVAFKLDTKKKTAPKYVFNCDRYLKVEATEVRGCDEYAKTDYIVKCEGHRLAISGHPSNQDKFSIFSR